MSTREPHTIALVVSALLLSTVIVAMVNVHRIHAWEKAQGYPFGHMCQSIFTAYADTCPATMVQP